MAAEGTLYSQLPGLKGFLNVLGTLEEPIGVFYTDREPEGGYSPKPGNLPSVEEEIRGEIDWGGIWQNFSCVIGNIWRARRKQSLAWFDRERFGCLGGAFYLGYVKPQLEFIVHYISTGIPGQMEGERYLESPEVTRRFFETIDPRPAPARYCVFKPLSRFEEGEVPEIVVFFDRPELIAGLNQMATFVTNDLEAVISPFGAGCTNIVTWPLHYLARGQMKAVLGGWDPSCRKYLKTDEITFAMGFEMFRRMVERWPESFLTTPTWQTVRKKLDRSRRTWGEIEEKA